MFLLAARKRGCIDFVCGLCFVKHECGTAGQDGVGTLACLAFNASQVIVHEKAV